MNNEELERMVYLEQQIKIMDKRIDCLETVTQAIYKQNENLEVLTNELHHTNENLNKHDLRISAMEKRSLDKLDKVMTGVITSGIGLILGYLFSLLIGGKL